VKDIPYYNEEYERKEKRSRVSELEEKIKLEVIEHVDGEDDGGDYNYVD
jgi:hypothetical protein